MGLDGGDGGYGNGPQKQYLPPFFKNGREVIIVVYNNIENENLVFLGIRVCLLILVYAQLFAKYGTFTAHWCTFITMSQL